jgi:cation:H+ antiporter
MPGLPSTRPSERAKGADARRESAKRLVIGPSRGASSAQPPSGVVHRPLVAAPFLHVLPNRWQFPGLFFALLMVSEPLSLNAPSPWSALWTTPCILLASIVITWGAESAQFFVAQGFALAILAWMQTLPEFAVEAVLAWRQQTSLLLAGLTGALRLLTGLAWPMIYATAAVVHRRREKQPLRKIQLDRHHSVEVVGLLFPLLYALVIWRKAELHLYDGLILICFYIGYLYILVKLPPQEREEIGELEMVPRKIVLAPRPWRIFGIAACFLIGGGLIYFTAAPFLGSLSALAIAFGIPTFVVIQWFAPVISEFPELLSTFYFARQEEKAPLALMNIASSNINQWTLLFAMLPIAFSLSRHSISAIPLDLEQQRELLLTIGQNLIAAMFLLNMEFTWLEALCLFVLFAAQFVLPPVFGSTATVWITAAFFAWVALEALLMLIRRNWPPAMISFLTTWREHVRDAD